MMQSAWDDSMTVFRLACVLVLAVAAPLRAAPPRVVTDIAPVQALVAEVMQGVGAPQVLLPPGMSPHHFTLRPSQARALQKADLIVWIGPELTPWLEKPVTALGGKASQIALLQHPQTLRRVFRQSEDGAPDDHTDHTQDGHASHDHAPGGTDPHAWLDPRNAAIWVGVVADRLARLDPENADTYRQNADVAAARLAALEAELNSQLASRPAYVAYHDAFQYFEARFGLTLVGTVAPGDATGPGPAHLAWLRDRIRDTGVTCLFREPQLNARLLETVAEGEGADIRILDPLGSKLDPGALFYERLLRAMADAFSGCSGRDSKG